MSALLVAALRWAGWLPRIQLHPLWVEMATHRKQKGEA